MALRSTLLAAMAALLVAVTNQEFAAKTGVGKDGNLRVCIVEGKGLYKKAGRFCPVLEREKSGVECVIGLDRLDCLRRISKGSVDFGVFTSEDLLAARWADVDVLVTDELRFHKDDFEYEIVALVDDRSKIRGLENLYGSRYCHPGYGYESDWTETLANFFESKIIPKLCDSSRSLMENKIRASSQYFSSACKAGPWVPDKMRDRVLKALYPSLCSSCYDQRSCSSGDKYWGRRGSLNCLSEEAGDIAWARLDDTRLHFGLAGVQAVSDPSHISYFCPDGSTQPVNITFKPCVWIAKPWPVVAAKRKAAAAVSSVMSVVNHDNATSWQSALLSLIEYYHVDVYPLRPQMPVQDYLEHAVGYQSANSFAECNPPRSIMICTNDIVSRHKCDWLAETARAYGVEPQFTCMNEILIGSAHKYTEHYCFDAVKQGLAEIAMAHPDFQILAKNKYDLEPIVFESTQILNDLYTVVAVVGVNSSITSFEHMRGKRACFPRHDGVAWNSVTTYLSNNNNGASSVKRQASTLGVECPHDAYAAEFFAGGACVPGATDARLKTLCGVDGRYVGELGALVCLVDGVADVAFMALRTLKNNFDMPGSDVLPRTFRSSDYRVVCPPTNPKDCYVAWSSIGHVHTRANSSDVRKQELINTFKQLDQLFGKAFRSPTNAFNLYGPFDQRHDVLFQDRTKLMRTYVELVDSRLHYNYEATVREFRVSECRAGGSSSAPPTLRRFAVGVVAPLIVALTAVVR